MLARRFVPEREAARGARIGEGPNNEAGRASGKKTFTSHDCTAVYTGVKSVNGQQIPLLQFVLLKGYRIGTSGKHKSWKIAQSVSGQR